MVELVIIVEGETEQTFVRQQLATHLAQIGINAWAVLPGKNRKQGGVKKWESACQDIIRTLKEGRYCSTMMDYYAMPTDWPGRADAKDVAWNDRAARVEAQLSTEIQDLMGTSFNPKFFVPYVQLHEFEALTFADIDQLVSVVTPLCGENPERLKTKLSAILAEAGHPEAIDDGYETCPSRRIAGVVNGYKKRAFGPTITQRIGLQVLRSKCDHFNSWLNRLEAIAVLQH